MNRRDLLKAVAPIAATVMTPLVVKGEEIGKTVQINPTAKYAVFVNDYMIDAEVLAYDHNSAFPEGTVIYPVKVGNSGSLDNAIRIFELK